MIFLSSTKRNASPNTIADYNTFVQGRAAAGHNDIQSYSTGFRVVGCTEAVDARDNTATTFTTNDKGVPIYWLNGTKVADEYEDFYDGSWDDEANDKDESGTDGLDASLNANRPLTGCDDDGTEAVDFANRSVALGSSLGVMIGRPNFATAGPLSSSTHSLPSVTRPMYGLSEVFEVSNVPAAISDVAVVPEPRTTDSLRVSWTAPNNTGKPALTAYDLRYKEFDADNWTTARQDDAASTSLIIDGLRTAYYDVQVRAINAEYSGPWSSTAEGATSPPSETVLANHPLIPADLGPGDSFRLLHVTSGTRAATGTGIHKYHDSVGSDPILLVDPAGLMDEWGGIFLHQRALVSTPGADARLHTDTTWTGTDRGVPIYWINGTRVADDYADLYDGAWDDEANPMNGFGEPRSLSGTAPWTGTSHDGTELFEGGVSRAVGQSMVGVGGPGSNVVGAGPLNGGVTFASTEERPLYGLWHVMVIDENLRLVSNLTQSRSDASSDDRATVRAQLFTTGPNSSGYGIARIKVDRGSETEDFLGTVALYTTDAQGDPDLANGLHATLSLESTFAYQWYLTAPVGTVVKPNTTYSLVFQGDGGTYPELWTSGADGEDLAAEGWSIADVLRYHDGSNWVDNGNGKSLRMRIIGTLAADTTEVPSNWGLKPTAVAAGSQFRLIFLSSTKRNADVTTISTYNTFVQNRAAAGHTAIRAYSAGFRVVGCTADVDARDNTSTTFTTEDKGVPIYWLNGAKVADEYEDFYDGDWDDEVNDKDESGTNGLDISLNVNSPFTGCAHNGTEALDGSISQGFAAVGGTKIGRPNSTGSGHGPLSSNAVGTTTNTRPMYGLSEVFQVAEPTNTPATGEPTISGTAAAGQTLTASTAGISDTDGLPSNFTYQWKRVDSDGMSNPTNIGADSATYTLTDDEVGKKVKVEVSFTDNESNSEGPLISAAYPSTGTVKAPIGPPQGLTAEAGDERVRLVWANPTGITQFTEYQYRYAAGTSVPSGTSWTGTGHAEALTLLLSGLTNATAHAFEVRVISDGREGAAATVSETPLAAVCNTDLGTRRELWSATMTVGANTGPSVGRNNAGYYRGNYGTLPQHGDTISIGDASYTIDYLNTSISPEGARRRIFLELVGDSRFTPAVKNAIQLHWCGESSGFFDPTPAGYLASNSHNADWSLYTTRELALSLPANNDATGTPMITGTAVVAQTLTVSTAGISDPDGLPTTFTYQWKRVDSDGMSNPTTIGADAATYTLTSSEVGKKVLVEVSFTDSLGEAESLASAAHPSTGTVRAADSTAPTVTSIERQDPTALLTNSDTPTWRVTFSEAVKNVDTTDFTIAGTTATPTATAVTLVPGGYDVTPTGGDIASLTGTITLTFAAAQNIADTADNDLAATMPTGTNEPTFEMENTIPRFVSGTANGVLIVLTFSEALDPDSLPPGAAFDISTNNSVTVDNVSIAGAIVTLTVTPAILVDQHVVVSNNAYDGAGYVPLKDFAGNEVLPAAQSPSYTMINNTPIGPPATLRAEPGDGRVRLVWTNPAGIPGFIGYQYRYAAGTSVPAGTSWTGTGDPEYLTLLLSGLANGTAHAFEVRAVRNSEVGATAAVSATPIAAVCNTPDLGDRREVWSAMLTVGGNTGPHVGETNAGYRSGISGSLPQNDYSFMIGADSYTINNIYTHVTGDGVRRRITLTPANSRRFTPAVKDALRFHWCSESSGFENPTAAGYRVSNPNEADWSIYTTRELALSLPANNSATGTPMITGTAVVAQTLTVSTAGISDPDGLPSAFDYQWKRVDSDGVSNPTNIGADATYTLTNNEVGKKVLVEVSFTDSLGEAESLASAAHPSTGTVRAADNTAPTVTSIERQDPTALLTNSDTPTWRVTFSEAVKNVDGTDFTIAGTTATPTATAVTLVPGGYDVTPTGGDIASLTGTITLTFAAAQNIADTADNDLAATAPTGTDEPTFELDNTIPAFDSGTANGVLIVLTFSEALDPDSLPPGAAFFINTITTNVSVDNVSIAGAIVTLTVSPPILVDQTVEVSNNAYDGAGYVPLKDFAGNEVTPAVQTGRYTITNNTPLGPPTTLRAEPGDGRVRLVWKNPAGIPGFIGHEYRHAAGSSVPAGTAWTRTTSKEFTTVLVQGLTNGTVHAFEVRAWRSSEVSPTATVSATPLAAVCNTNLGDRREVWSATMTVGTDTDSITGSTGAGYVRGSYGNFPPNGDIISIGGDSYTIKHIFTAVRGSGATRGLFLESVDDRRLTPAVKDAIQLHWCNESSGLTERTGRGYRVTNPNDADWSIYNTRELALSLPANNPATGKPAITGGALIGQTLTATTGTVADPDGLPSAFTYQWKRVDSDGVSNPTNIGTDSATYTLTSSEVGKKVLVEVSFTDSLTSAESRTSDAHPSSRTVAVGGSVALREDSYYAFDNSDFSYAISSGTLASLTITEMPASGTLTKGGRPINNLPDNIPTTGSQRRTLLYKPPPDAHGTPYTTFKFKVNEETTVHTMTINVTSVNDRAYGKVFISGPSQVGYDLTASTSSMGDRDGIPRDQLDYQWKRYAADGTTFEADIGTNSSTYTLTSSEQGKKIRVEVSYVDGGGTREVRLSEAFPYITDQTVGEATFQSIMGSAGDTFYVVSDKDHGQAFTTGTHPNGYTLSRVVLQSEDAEGDDLAVKICGVNTNGDPTAVCTDLTVPGSFTKGLLSFTAPSNTTLTGGRTNYMVVISSPGSQSVRLDATRSDGFDSSALGSGWSIATKTRMKTTDGWKNVNGTRIRIAILGAINP